MSVQTGPRSTGAPGTYESYEDDRGWGWLAFSGALLLTVATLNIIDGINAIAQLLMMPAYPFWSLSIFAVDILTIYGLVAYGARINER